jgi:predicted nucleic acid-binding protein
MTLLLDTSILIDVLRGKEDIARAVLETARKGDELRLLRLRSQNCTLASSLARRCEPLNWWAGYDVFL